MEASETLAGVMAAVPLPASTAGHDGLDKEVEAFLAQREQLAQRLAHEIAATEQRLEELKRTAALLFPEAPSPPAKERKAKKPGSPKGSKRSPDEVSGGASTAASDSPSSDSPTSDEPTVPAGAPHEPHLD
jgi:hypothetical protein